MRTLPPSSLTDPDERALEQHTILAVLHASAYADLSPRTVFAMLLDAGRYLASVSTFYRLRGTAQWTPPALPVQVGINLPKPTPRAPGETQRSTLNSSQPVSQSC